MPPKWLAARGLTAPLTLELLLASAAAVSVSREDVNFGSVFQPVCLFTAEENSFSFVGMMSWGKSFDTRITGRALVRELSYWLDIYRRI